jgi:signal transduction histidine kinase/CheY-like chemotaxis protein
MSALFFILSCVILYDKSAQLPHLIFPPISNDQNQNQEIILGKHKMIHSFYDRLHFSECNVSHLEPLLGGYIDAKVSKAAMIYLFVIATSAAFCVAFLASSFSTLKIEKHALYTISSLFLFVCILYTILVAGNTSTACYNAQGIFQTTPSTTRVFQPLIYSFWLSAVSLSSVSLSRYSSTTTKFYSALWASLTVLSGLVAILIHSIPNLHFLFILIGATTLSLHTFFLMRSVVEILENCKVMSVFTRIIIIPSILFIHLLVPLVWLLAQYSIISVSTESTLLTILNFAQVVLISTLLIAIELSVIMSTQKDNLNDSEIKRKSAEDQRTSVRGFMRYSFHELRVPLNTIALGIDDVRASLNDTVLALRTPNGKSRDLMITEKELESAISSLEVISLSAQVMSKLLDDFLSLEKIESGKLVLETTTFRVDAMIHDTIAAFIIAAETKKIRMFLSIDYRVKDVMTGDMLKLQQVLSNFFSNAIKFVPSGGSIIILHVEPEMRAFNETFHKNDNNNNNNNKSESNKDNGLRNRNTTGGILQQSFARTVQAFSNRPRGSSPIIKDSSSRESSSNDNVLILDNKALEDLETLLARAQSGMATQQLDKMTYPCVKGFNTVHVLPKMKQWEKETYCEKSLRENETAKQTTPWIRFSVIDNGPGISEQDQMKLFKPFQQVSSGAQQKGSGTGLGLSIAARIVNQSDGRIGVSSTIGLGSNFWMSLPVSGPLINTQPSITSSNSATSSTILPLVKRVLAHSLPVRLDCAIVCDDVSSNRMFFGRLLLRRGVQEVLYAEDGVELLAILDDADVRKKVQVVFLDNEMPNMNGHEAVSRMRQRNIEMPVIGVTGSALERDKINFLNAGCDKVLLKPIHFGLLSAALSEVGLDLVIDASLDGLHEQAPGVKCQLYPKK